MAKAKRKREETEGRVEVTWEDIASYGVWTSRDNLAEMTPLMCESVGYLLEKNKVTVKIAQTRSENDKIGETLVIPTGNVKKIRKLRY